MAEINIKITELDSAITRLENLRSECSAAAAQAPETVGGGQTVNELEAIGEIYKDINLQFEELVANTISFFMNIRNSYAASDQKAAKGITGGSGGGFR